MNPKKSPLWNQLVAHQKTFEGVSLRQLFAEDSERFKKFSIKTDHLFLDFSKNKITEETLSLLIALAEERGVMDLFSAMCAGEPINTTENKPVAHLALRDLSSMTPDVKTSLEAMRRFVHRIHSGEHRGATGKVITDIVNIGIGGSDLGPRFVTQALAQNSLEKVQLHFVSNMDASDLHAVLKNINPEQTLFIISSKSFSTMETMSNARLAKAWLQKKLPCVDQHLVAVTANVLRAEQFGFLPEAIFSVSENVGGRYSVWSSIGLPIALSIGMDPFMDFLAGAHSMDQHFATAAPRKNLPLMLALIGLWSINFWDIHNQAIITYGQPLENFYAYLRQVDMESNGKSVLKNGERCDFQTSPLIWGGVGTNVQHSFFQCLHQGTQSFSVDFIVPVHGEDESHKWCYANAISQSRVLMMGKTMEETAQEEGTPLAAHKVIPGDYSSNTLLLDKISPRTLGALLAAYELKIFVQGAIWGLNSFDQFGVEFGKKMADQVFPLLSDASLGGDHLDSSTRGLIHVFVEGL